MTDATKKAQFEQRAIIGLLIFFLFALSGALKNMGMFGARVARRPALPVPSMATPAGRVQAGSRPAPTPQGQPRAGQRAHVAGGKTGYTAQALRDPFKSLLPTKNAQQPNAASASGGSDASSGSQTPGMAVQAPPLPQLSVQGLWWQGSKPLAIINGRVYEVGEQVDGATITAITRTGVIVAFHGTTMQITTNGSSKHSGALSQNAQWR